MDILKYVDILVGLTLVMVLASTVVAAAGQIITAMTFARARHLRDGVAEIVKQLDPKLEEHGDYIAELVLRHPMVARPNTWFGRFTTWLRNLRRGAAALPSTNPAAVIQREELIRILLEWASEQGPLAEFAGKDGAPEKAKQAMNAVRDAVKENGVPDAAQVLTDIRRQALAEEQANPQLSATERHSRAVIAASANDFTGKVFSWFDNSMQRIADHFTLEAKMVTSVIALGVVLAIQLDSAQLLQRLSSDDKFRQGLVDQAKELNTDLESTRKAAQTPEAIAELKQIESRVREEKEKIEAALARMRAPALDVIPDHLIVQKVQQLTFDPGKFAANESHTLVLQVGGEKTTVTFRDEPIKEIRTGLAAQGARVKTYVDRGGALRIVAISNQVDRMSVTVGNEVLEGKAARDFSALWTNWPGLVLSWVLLSLGAPFWFDALKNLLKFRSVLAQREDKERDSRTLPGPATQPAKAPDDTAPNPALLSEAAEEH